MTRRPTSRTPGAVLLFHGAGSDRDHSSLVLLEQRLALPVVRGRFPYRTRPGRRPPDREPVLLASVEEHAAALARSAGVAAQRIVLGGRSMGGRMCSIAVARGVPAAGLVLISYPLHPPGKPERLRTEHFPALQVPCLFVSGTRDAFGSPAELEAATRAIPGHVTHVWIEGGRHELAGADEAIADAVQEWLSGQGVRPRRAPRGSGPRG